MKRVVAAVIRRGERVLLARRAPGQSLEGAWEFPGGKVNAGETDQDALRRELFEEFGVESSVGRFLTSSRYLYDHGAIELLAYAVQWGDAEPCLTVHDRIEWVEAVRLTDMALAPADVPIAEWIATYEPEAE